MISEQKRLEEEVALPISLADQICKSVVVSTSFKAECTEIGAESNRISQLLVSTVRLASTSSSSSIPVLYERPIRCIASQAVDTLELALALVQKCEPNSTLRRVFTIIPTSEFRKMLQMLRASISDLEWLPNVYDPSDSVDRIFLCLPPVWGNNNPITCWVWSFITAIEMHTLPNRIQAAKDLANLARESDESRKIIVEQGGISSLSKPLKQWVSPDAQIAAATALSHLANHIGRVTQIMLDLGTRVIVNLLSDSPIEVQIPVANLVSRMTENNPFAQEEFAVENAIRALVSLLSFYVILDERKRQPGEPRSFHHLVQFNKQTNLMDSVDASTSNGENAKLDLQLMLKTKCAEALWCLCKDSVSNSKRITETKGLLCLAKYIDKEKGELQLHCLMVVQEIAVVMESNAIPTGPGFSTYSPAFMAIRDQLLRVVTEEDNPSLLVASIKSIGSLGITYPIAYTQVIGPLVTLLDHRDWNVATEAVVALGKFACPNNILCDNHTKAIIEFDGIRSLMRLVQPVEKMTRHDQLHGLILLCYLALHVEYSKALEEENMLSLLKIAARDKVFQVDPVLGKLIPDTIFNLEHHYNQLPDSLLHPALTQGL